VPTACVASAVCALPQALVPLKRAVDEVVIPAVAKAEIRDRIAALTRRYLDAQKVGGGCGRVGGSASVS
jgi:hypothetical protein